MQICPTIPDNTDNLSQTDPRQRFLISFQETMQDWYAWLETHPPHGDVQKILDDSLSAFWGIAATASAGMSGAQNDRWHAPP